jgi:hypothetical protein
MTFLECKDLGKPKLTNNSVSSEDTGAAEALIAEETAAKAVSLSLLIRDASLTFTSALKLGTRAKSCGIQQKRHLNDRDPELGCILPMTKSKRVDLPTPEGPKIPQTSPSDKENETRSRIVS